MGDLSLKDAISQQVETTLRAFMAEFGKDGIDGEEEARAVLLTATAQRLRQMKLVIADTLIAAREDSAAEQFEGAKQKLKTLRELKNRYRVTHDEWVRLGGPALQPHNGLSEEPAESKVT